MTWQPIETAPKDGTRVLVSCGDRAYVARWLNGWNTWGVSVRKSDGNEGSFDDIGRIAFGAHVVQDGPTHWMPLPEPPA